MKSNEQFVDRFVWGVILVLVFIFTVIAGLFALTWLTKPTPHIPIVEHPIIVQQLFQRGDCFDGLWDKEPKESWELVDSPDGIIERVGHNNYLILFRDQAEKRGGDKIGLSMSIATFDRHHTKVECPTSWRLHTHTNHEG